MNPAIRSDGSIYWERLIDEKPVQVIAKELRQERTGFHAQVTIGYQNAILAYDTFNIGRQEDRTRLAKSAFLHFRNGMDKEYPLDLLKHDLDLFCIELPGIWKGSEGYLGSPVVALDKDTVIMPPEYLIRPFIFKGQSTIIFGHGGTAKSFLALFMAVIAATPWLTNPVKAIPPPGGIGTIYLDWETEEGEIRWRLKALRAGCGIPAGRDIIYRRCTRPLADDVEALKKIIADMNIGFLVVDSIAGACGGDLNENKQANGFFSALRDLQCGSLVVTHLAKGMLDKKGATPFGSSYFWNWARSIWEIKKSQESGEDNVALGLFHRKANNSKLQYPIGLKLGFISEDEVLQKLIITRVDLADNEELSKDLSVPLRILKLLSRTALETEKIAEVLDAKIGTVRVALTRLARSRQIMKRGETWVLVGQEEPDQEDDLPF